MLIFQDYSAYIEKSINRSFSLVLSTFLVKEILFSYYPSRKYVVSAPISRQKV